MLLLARSAVLPQWEGRNCLLLRANSVFARLRAAFAEFMKERGSDLKAECYVPKEVDTLIKNGIADVRVLESNDSWFGVTYPDDKPDVVRSIRELVDKGVYPESLWS